jgi:hypothetical protein
MIGSADSAPSPTVIEDPSLMALPGTDVTTDGSLMASVTS